MGNEAICAASLNRQKARGKALLETSELIFRSEDGALRLKIPFSTVKSAKAVDGQLQLEIPEGLAVFSLGANAAKWCEKILHPKSRIDKLGVKPSDAVSLLGAFDADFLEELRGVTKNVTKDKPAKDAQWTFFVAASSKDLAQVPKLAKSLTGAASLWIVYPKGQQAITENDVLAAGRKAGLKDIKVVGFSPIHTALKFVIPVERR